jgi:hypothetical protein
MTTTIDQRAFLRLPLAERGLLNRWLELHGLKRPGRRNTITDAGVTIHDGRVTGERYLTWPPRRERDGPLRETFDVALVEPLPEAVLERLRKR